MVSLHIDTGAEMRGGQWQVLYLLRGLASENHTARLLAPPRSELFQAAQAQRLDVRPLRLASLARAVHGADLIHAHDARAHSLALLFGKPVIVSRRVAFPIRRGIPSRWKYRRAAHFLAVSEFVKATLVDTGVDPARISVVHDGVPIPPPLGHEQRERVLALDSDDPRKGKHLIEKAAALADIPVAFSKNLGRDLPAAALFVYISDSEGLGSAALLAMAHGVPVIASAVGGLPEIVEDGCSGLLTSNEPDQIARHIRRLLDDRSLAHRLAACARARAEQNFSIGHMVAATLRVYERMVV